MSVSRRVALVLLGGTLCGACAPSSPARAKPTGATPAATIAPESNVPGGLTIGATPPAAAAPTPNAPPRSTPGPPAPEAAATTAGREEVLPGVDVLMRERLDVLAGRKLGLLTNATGLDRGGRSTIDVLRGESSWQLVALFSPEHGIRGDADAGATVDSGVDPQTGLPVYSLYGQTTRPTPQMLRGVDTLVYDIQDVGARTYTYIATLLELMRAAAQYHLPLVVLDRPNPIGGEQVEGNVLDPAFASFVGPAPLAMRYGLTIGELGQWFNGELGVGADLSVVPLRTWSRTQWFDQTGLRWVNPSPNVRSLAAATLYPGTVLVEGTNLSEGRGTDRPFQWLGAPWIDASAWAEALNTAAPPGASFSAAEKTPDSSKFAGQRCQGVLIEITDRAMLQPMALGVALIEAARRAAPGRVQFNASTFDSLAGTDRIRRALEAGTPAANVVAAWQPALQAFRAGREKYVLYS